MPLSKTSLYGDPNKFSERLIAVSKELQEGHPLSTRLRTARKDGRVWAVIKEILAKIGIKLERLDKEAVAIKLHEFIEKNKKTLFADDQGTQNGKHFIKILENVLNVDPNTQKLNEPDQKLQKIFDDCAALINPIIKGADLKQKKEVERVQKEKEEIAKKEQEAKKLADKQKKEAAEKVKKEKVEAKKKKDEAAKLKNEKKMEIKSSSSKPEMKSALAQAAKNMKAATEKFMKTSQLAKKLNKPQGTSGSE
ncbi:MAG: hypothetical protein CK425_12475 [Parachlamydia sp.]|nr:MAG: hypothetical protein CK425_12475 [Parachlamydia sp.]